MKADFIPFSSAALSNALCVSTIGPRSTCEHTGIEANKAKIETKILTIVPILSLILPIAPQLFSNTRYTSKGRKVRQTKANVRNDRQNLILFFAGHPVSRLDKHYVQRQFQTWRG